MKSHPKNPLRHGFQYAAGMLLLEKAGGYLYSYQAPRIDRFIMPNPTKHIRTSIGVSGKDAVPFNVNFSVAHHFYMRALQTNMSFDLRPICEIPKEDELYKASNDHNASLEAKQALAARVKLIKPQDFI